MRTNIRHSTNKTQKKKTNLPSHHNYHMIFVSNLPHPFLQLFPHPIQHKRHHINTSNKKDTKQGIPPHLSVDSGLPGVVVKVPSHHPATMLGLQHPISKHRLGALASLGYSRITLVENVDKIKLYI